MGHSIAARYERDHYVYTYLLPDPMNWTQEHVCQWLNWAEQEFGLNSINLSKFDLSGAQLCSLTKEEFVKRSPPFTGDVLYTHLNLLRARGGKSQSYKKHNVSPSLMGECRKPPLKCRHQNIWMWTSEHLSRNQDTLLYPNSILTCIILPLKSGHLSILACIFCTTEIRTPP